MAHNSAIDNIKSKVRNELEASFNRCALAIRFGTDSIFIKEIFFLYRKAMNKSYLRKGTTNDINASRRVIF